MSGAVDTAKQLARLPGWLARLTTNRRLPLNLRRTLGRWFVPRDGRPFRVELDGRPFEGALDNYIEWVVFVTRAHFEYTYLALVRRLVSGGLALDVGANVGNHTHAFAAHFDCVLAFEPYPPVAARLERRAAALPNVSTYRLALGERAETLRFAPPTTDNWGRGRIASDGTLEVPVVVGDAWLACEGAGRAPVNFLKVDVEGHELPVLRGLRETLLRDRPVAMFEVPRALRAEADGLQTVRALFPADYELAALCGQSTFPVQVEVARVRRIDSAAARLPRGASYLLAYGPERGVALRGRELRRGSTGADQG